MSNDLMNCDKHIFKKTLDLLNAGEQARLSKCVAEPETALRLAELGLTEGTVVYLVRKAPLGDPLELYLRGYRLCIRKETAKQFYIVQAKQTALQGDVLSGAPSNQ